MKAFDYLFYRVADFYFKWFKDENAEALGALLVAMMQVSHIMSFLIIIAFFSKDVNYYVFKINEGKYFLYSYNTVFVMCLLGFNIVRYFGVKNYDVVRKKWANDDSVSRNQKGIVIVIYIISNFLVSIVLAIIKSKYL